MRQSGSAGSAEERGRELARKMFAVEDDVAFAPAGMTFPDEEDDLDECYPQRNNNLEDAEDDVLNEANDKVEADAMPPEYYDQVDRFLSIPPPKVVGKRGGSLDSLAAQKPPKNIFSKGAMRPLPAAPAISTKKIAAKVDSGSRSTGAKKKAIEIDHTLLQEAFAYTDKLVRDTMMEDAFPQPLAPSRATDARYGDHGTKGARKATSEVRADSRASEVGSILHNAMIKQSANIYSGSDQKARKKKDSLVNKIRRHVVDNPTFSGADNAPESSGTFGVAAVPEEDPRKNAVDFNELVSNFTAGTTIQRLRNELTESQSAMNRSRSFIDQLAREFNIKK